MIKRRPIEVFSLSFLDCLCCGFGAILLLFILTIGSGPHGVESEVDVPTLQAMREKLAMLEADIADKTAILSAAINSEDSSQERARIMSLIQELESKLADPSRSSKVKRPISARHSKRSPKPTDSCKVSNTKTSHRLACRPMPLMSPSSSTPPAVCATRSLSSSTSA